MLRLETVNELTLKVTSDGAQTDMLYTKAGAFISGQSMGTKNYKFEKVLLGPQGNPIRAALGQLGRRFTGENLPLMKVTMNGQSITYYANEEQHVVVIPLGNGETLSVESENILAFTPDCRYGIRFLAQGVISQKGWATSTITGTTPYSQAAILVDGNPILLSNINDGSTLTADPDALVAWVGRDPGLQMDLSWKNLIGQASGESYMFEWNGNSPATIIMQPNERTSGLNLGMDGGSSGQRASRQQNQTLGQAAQNVQSTLGQVGNMMGNQGGTVNNGNNTLGGIGSLFGF